VTRQRRKRAGGPRRYATIPFFRGAVNGAAVRGDDRCGDDVRLEPRRHGEPGDKRAGRVGLLAGQALRDRESAALRVAAKDDQDSCLLCEGISSANVNVLAVWADTGLSVRMTSSGWSRRRTTRPLPLLCSRQLDKATSGRQLCAPSAPADAECDQEDNLRRIPAVALTSQDSKT
jgi:hypothetical protein